MNCEKYLNLLDDLLEGELETQLAEQVNSHLFTCARCEAELAMLRREKEMFAQYLFDIEPAEDLQAKFEAKLGAEKQKTFSLAESLSGVFDWQLKLFNSLGLYPALALGAAVIAIGIGWIWLNYLPDKNNQVTFVRPNIDDIQPEIPKPKQYESKEIMVDLPKIIKETTVSPKVIVKTAANKFFTASKKVENPTKPVPVRTTPKPKTTSAPMSKENLSEVAGLSAAEQMQLKQRQAFEFETAKHIEKVELLLRSFRNARFAENSDQYDVGYEKQQARKLLEKNIQLRRQAENYGMMFSEEMLSKVEPYLLDIANLDNNPQREQVVEIKERVKSQSIIASLQTY